MKTTKNTTVEPWVRIPLSPPVCYQGVAWGVCPECAHGGAGETLVKGFFDWVSAQLYRAYSPVAKGVVCF